MTSGGAERFRRAILYTRLGQAAKRIVRPRARIPLVLDADPSRLLPFAGDDLFPVELRDPQILAKALASRQAEPADTAPGRRPSGSEPHTIENVLLISHSDFTGNSALHVFNIAHELERLGFSPAIAVPQAPEGMPELGEASFAAVGYAEAPSVVFPNGRGPDVVHAFSPRELVRALTTELVRSFQIPYVVHLEDNDASILAADLGVEDASVLRGLPVPLLDRLVRPGHAHPLRSEQFLELAAGVTVITERLLELAPRGVPTRVIHAGFDAAVLEPNRPRDEVRAGLGLAPGDVVVTYTGSVHSANLEDMRSLYMAVAALRRAGRPIVLVKTGADSPEALRLPKLRRGIRNLGRVPRDAIPDLLHAADILVQPGAPGAFNDFRFPSKLPEFLASGRPVILPRANAGLELEDGAEALVLDHGNAEEIADAIERLADDPELRTRVGEGGRAYAVKRLTWSSSGKLVADLYREISSRPYATATELDRSPLPLQVLAVIPGAVSAEEAQILGEHGVGGIAPPQVRAEPPLVYVDGLADWLHCGMVADPIPFPSSNADIPLYGSWVRKAVLQALAHEQASKTKLYLCPGSAWNEDERRTAFLTVTRTGIQDGLRQWYASRGLKLDVAQTERLVG